MLKRMDENKKQKCIGGRLGLALIARPKVDRKQKNEYIETDNENLRQAEMFKQIQIKKYKSDQPQLLSK